ncbi:hypothetical protein T440DRAFT_481276 [Plenodomus tracheiphilus IPT5]|uniref:Uncharacterized protein n=1 Tax=Plenodomus tracheiphilus IPT5 TaxID=1408161 RepID=A0A6A7AXE3_9PLEO|nr:hypothetical protein T440DRAFT_481276 [Plenodomus tracheiphilus IPT5]
MGRQGVASAVRPSFWKEIYHTCIRPPGPCTTEGCVGRQTRAAIHRHFRVPSRLPSEEPSAASVGASKITFNRLSASRWRLQACPPKRRGREQASANKAPLWSIAQSPVTSHQSLRELASTRPGALASAVPHARQRSLTCGIVLPRQLPPYTTHAVRRTDAGGAASLAHEVHYGTD